MSNICFLFVDDSYTTPVNYDKETCKVIFNKKNCDYDVVQKHPSKQCTRFTRIG